MCGPGGLLQEPEEREEGVLGQPDPGRRELGVVQKEELDLNGGKEGGPKGETLMSEGGEVGMPNQERLVGGLMPAHDTRSLEQQGQTRMGKPAVPLCPPLPLFSHCWEETGRPGQHQAGSCPNLSVPMSPIQWSQRDPPCRVEETGT